MVSDVPAIKTQCHVIGESEVTCIYNIVIVIYIYRAFTIIYILYYSLYVSIHLTISASQPFIDVFGTFFSSVSVQ